MTQEPQKTEQVQEAPAAAARAAKPRPIAPSSVTKQCEGFCWTEWFVRLPRDVVFGDLVNAPELWRAVQGDSRTALKKLDRVTLVDYDEKWMATAVVAAATGSALTLSKPVKIDLDPRTEGLFEDAAYRILWVGNGYRVQRKADNQFVTAEVPSLALAERDLRNQYARKVA